MKKVVSFGLCFMIVLCSFVLCFADNMPIIIPVGEYGSDVGYSFETDDISGATYTFSSNTSPTYVFWYHLPNDDLNYCICFSENPNTEVYRYVNSPISTLTLSNEYNGFYYSWGVNENGIHPKDGYFHSFDTNMSVTDVIDYVDNNVFKTTFDLSYIIDGSVSWLSSIAQAVKANGLLLFFCLVGFVGISIGLLERFKRG